MRSIGPRLQVDGEEKYREQISKIIQQQKTWNAEMGALTESFAANATEEEKAAAKSELLSKQLEAARQRTKLLREMTEKAAEVTGKGSTQTLQWAEATANAAREEYRLTHAMEENTKVLEDNWEAFVKETQGMTGLGDQIDGLTSKLGFSLPDAAKDALNGMEGFSTGTVAAMAAAAAGIAAVYKGVSALHELTLEAAQQADALLTRSAKTGLDTETLQGLDYAQRFLDFDGIEQSLTKLTASMDKARDGAEKQAAAFETLGVSVTNADGSLRGNYETFLEAIDALGQVQNATERDTIANDLFGKSYAELKPLIDAGSDALQGYMDQAKATGKILSEDQVKALGEVDDAHQELIATIEAEKNKMAADYAPAAKAAMDTFARAVQKGGQALIDSKLIENTAAIVTSVLDLINAGMDLADAIPSWLSPLESLSKQLEGVDMVVENLVDSAKLLYHTLTFDVVGAYKDLGRIVNNIQAHDDPYRKYGSNYQDYYTEGYIPQGYDPQTYWTDTPRNALGTESWRGGLTWVGEEGPELVALPQGTRIWSNAESERIAAAGTDTSRMEALLAQNVTLLSEIYGVVLDQRAIRRMA